MPYSAPYRIALDRAIEEFHSSAFELSKSTSTRKHREYALRVLLAVSGNILACDLRPHHFDKCLQRLRAGDGGRCTGRSDASLNLDKSNLRSFCRWLRAEEYVAPSFDVGLYLEPNKRAATAKNFERIPAERFGPMLEAAGARHPRDRAAIALGLYTLNRPGESAVLTLADARMDDYEINVFSSKTGKRKWKPMSTELHAELETWLRWYTILTGQIPAPDWWLLPACTPCGPSWRTSKAGQAQMNPHWPVAPHRPAGIEKIRFVVKHAMRAVGYHDAQLDGEGGHTLRRSAALALYEQWTAEGHDAAMRYVQSMLGHASIAETERYLGLEQAASAARQRVQGKPMFRTPDAGRRSPVVRLADWQTRQTG